MRIERNLACKGTQPVFIESDRAREALMVDDRIAIAKIDQQVEPAADDLQSSQGMDRPFAMRRRSTKLFDEKGAEPVCNLDQIHAADLRHFPARQHRVGERCPGTDIACGIVGSEKAVNGFAKALKVGVTG